MASSDEARNVLGRIVGGLAVAEGLREPGGLYRNLALRQQLLGNPETRAGLVGSPFQAGLLGVGGAGAPGVGPAARSLAGAGIAPGMFLPNLPPLDAATQLKQSLAEAGAGALAGGGAQARLRAGRHAAGLPQTLAEQLADMGINIPGTTTPSGQAVPGTTSIPGSQAPYYVGSPDAQPSTLPSQGASQAPPPLTIQDLINLVPGLSIRQTPQGPMVDLGSPGTTVLPAGATALPAGTVPGRNAFRAPPKLAQVPSGAAPSQLQIPGYSVVEKPPAGREAAEKLLPRLISASAALDPLVQPIVDPTTGRSAVDPSSGRPLRPIDTLGSTLFSMIPVVPGKRLEYRSKQPGVPGYGAQQLISAQGQTSNIARIFGEVGNLNENEQARVAAAFIPNANDTPTSGERKVVIFKQTIAQIVEGLKAGASPDQLANLIYASAAAASSGAVTAPLPPSSPTNVPTTPTSSPTTTTALPLSRPQIEAELRRRGVLGGRR